MKKLLILFVLLASGQLFSQQENLRITFFCKDRDSGDPAYSAAITIHQDGKTFTGKTGKKGIFSIELSDTFEIDVEVQHGYYIPVKRHFKLTDFTGSGSHADIEILLDPRIRDLKAVTVAAPGIPQVVYQSKTYSVADFEVLPEGEVLLLLYPKTLKKGSELAVLSGDEIVSKFELPDKPVELVHDFRRNPHVVCETGVFGVHRSKEGVGISTLDKSYFLKYVLPIVDTSYSRLYFSNFNKSYPAFDYKIYDQLDSTYSDILEIKDDLMMELYRSEYKWVDVRTKLWAKEKELETGIDKEIWVGANYFTQSIYYKELYAPMFKKDDSIYVFDYYKDKLYSFNLKGEKLDSVPIYHHYEPKKTGWRKQLIQDQETGEIYAFCEKDGICSLRPVDLKSGNLGKNIVFEHRYIDKIAVSGGMAYYIYRPFESAQKKFLYRAKLP
ncbi:MAG: hypothetical protein ACO1O6_00865 [Bacteroidota bacterium]